MATDNNTTYIVDSRVFLTLYLVLLFSFSTCTGQRLVRYSEPAAHPSIACFATLVAERDYSRVAPDREFLFLSLSLFFSLFVFENILFVGSVQDPRFLGA